jgi:glycylpeptide N-tetradecanoyltransferase
MMPSLVEAENGGKKKTDSQSLEEASSTEQDDGPIVTPSPDELRQTPYTMPAGFVWSQLDLSDPSQVSELYDLLTNNYVEDDDALFRFDYSVPFLHWALSSPGSRPEFLVCVRRKRKGHDDTESSTAEPSTPSRQDKLVAFISAIPTRIQIHAKQVDVVEINFLCIHKKLRAKRLAPVLIKEITRRVNVLAGVFQAVYTAGTVLPVPVGAARYYHRSLHPKKLIQVGFSRYPNARMTMARLQKLYKLPTEPVSFAFNTDSTAATSSRPSASILRPMQPKDVAGVHALLSGYLEKFPFHVCFTPDEIEHWFLPRENVINSYVAVQPNSDDGGETITDFISFYHLPSSILQHPNETLRAAYSFYNVAATVTLQELLHDALILAKNECQSDVFNALALMDQTESLLSELKFGKGDGVLQYYIYNWSCPKLTSQQVGIVLL